MYRNDAEARIGRASSLIDEIAELERQKLSLATTDERLEEARRELSALQVHAPTAPERAPGLLTHVLVFGATAAVAYLGYTLLM